jgi:putative peptide maturation dehydrogenase
MDDASRDCPGRRLNGESNMRIRRCAVLYLEPREEVAFDLDGLLSGGDGLRRTPHWLALAPHLGEEVEVDATERELLGTLSPGEWRDSRTMPDELRAPLRRLLKAGLVIGSTKAHAAMRARDEALRGVYWHPLSATLHAFTRWRDADAVQAMKDTGTEFAAALRDVLGAPPPEAAALGDEAARLPLPRSDANGFDELLARRTTCRNFDADRPLPLALFAQLMQRVFAAQAQVRVADDTVFLKKTSPSGGGLHPVEAYLLVRNVEGLAPGLYHYHATTHALEPLPFDPTTTQATTTAAAKATNGTQAPTAEPSTLREPPLPPRAGEGWDGGGQREALADASDTDEAATEPTPLDRLALDAVAGQHWFANAHALVLLAPRFDRTFWKYRQHAKGYRVVALEAGHLSQTLYLAATEAGLGAFITGAINEVLLERAFGLDPVSSGALAVCGFGWRADEMVTTELDPNGAVWTNG